MSGPSEKRPRKCLPIEVVAQIGRNSKDRDPIWAYRSDVKKALVEMYPSHTDKQIEWAITESIEMRIVGENKKYKTLIVLG